MSKLYISKSHDPFFNLAVENCLFNGTFGLPASSAAPSAAFAANESESILYLWCNSDVVVIGRFQNPWKECALEVMEKEGVTLMRRDTGGGAVFQDTGNLCFTFIGAVSEGYREKNTALLCQALVPLGIRAAGSGRNDILVEGAKVSGAAYREKDGRYIHHGTLLVSTDLNRLARLLNPDKKKLESKGVQSVRSRVTTFNTFVPHLQVSDVQDVLSRAWQNGNLGAQKMDRLQPLCIYLDMDQLEKNPALRLEYDRLCSWDWRFGKSPEFTNTLDERFTWGGIELQLNVVQGLIETCAVFSDALNTDLVPELQKLLPGTVYSKKAVQKKLLEGRADLQPMLQDVASLF